MPVTLVLYVPPHDLLHVLGDLVEGLGPGRSACVARELTKLHETFHRWGAWCKDTQLHSAAVHDTAATCPKT